MRLSLKYIMRLSLKYHIRLSLNILYAIAIKHILCDCH